MDPQAISLQDVSRSIESAIKLAAERHKVAIESDTLIDRWEIFGRRLKDIKDLNLAYDFAAEVTKSVHVAGLQVVPVVTRFDRHIFVGFIDKNRITMVLPR